MCQRRRRPGWPRGGGRSLQSPGHGLCSRSRAPDRETARGQVAVRRGCPLHQCRRGDPHRAHGGSAKGRRRVVSSARVRPHDLRGELRRYHLRSPAVRRGVPHPHGVAVRRRLLGRQEGAMVSQGEVGRGKGRHAGGGVPPEVRVRGRRAGGAAPPRVEAVAPRGDHRRRAGLPRAVVAAPTPAPEAPSGLRAARVGRRGAHLGMAGATRRSRRLRRGGPADVRQGDRVAGGGARGLRGIRSRRSLARRGASPRQRALFRVPHHPPGGDPGGTRSGR